MDLRRLHRPSSNRIIGRTIIALHTTASTNDIARDLAERGASEGTLVVADYQNAGRGRHGRLWLADPGDCLLLSVVLRPAISPKDSFYLTMVPALAIVRIIQELGVQGVGVKWPNDVEINGQKVAGILTELNLRGQQMDYAVVGVGLNVNLDVARHPEIAEDATSLLSVIGSPSSREDLARCLCETLEERYLDVVHGRAATVLNDWRASLTTLGKWVKVSDGSTRYDAFAVDVTVDGGLVLLRGGQRLVVYSGDVTLAKRSPF